MIDRDDATDDLLDARLREHLMRQLEPHRGRALAAFEAGLQRDRTRRPRRWIIAVAASGLIAASVALAVFLHVPARPIAPKGPIARGPDDRMRNILQVTEWEASDEGITVLDRSIPVRKVRQDAVEQVQWFDPQRNASMRLTVPVERVLYVQEETY